MKKDLWIRLKKYRFENLVPVSLADRVRGAFGSTDAFTRAFAAKVAKKHGWTDEYAFLAVREYKKMVFLGVISKYAVTPSSVLDKVWHEHQLFTKGYREFCRNVLGQYFDHSPELIPFDMQTEVFSAQYKKTLEFYKHEFGMEPPPEIWGRPKFDPASVKGTIKKPEKKATYATQTSSASSDSDTPLHTMFSSQSDAAYAPIPVTFSGHGGTGGGGGASGTWTPETSQLVPDAAPQATSCSTATSCSAASSCGGSGGGGC
jgi:hypothetical protein